MAYRKPSPAYLAARSLAKKISEMTEEQKQAFLAKFPAIVTVEGHPLTVHNMVMALNQREDATVIGGFRQWQQAGRQVRQGQKAIWTSHHRSRRLKPLARLITSTFASSRFST